MSSASSRAVRSRRLLLGILAVLIAVALGTPLAPATQAAEDQETCDPPTPPEADTQNNLQFVPISLNSPGPSADPHQPIEFQIKNNATQRFGTPPPEVQSIRATIVGCREGQVLPDPSTTEMSDGKATSMSMAWAADFTWNGGYDVMIEATGRRWGTTSYVEQTLRVVKRINLAVPPKKPSGVKASVANGVVTVTWSNTAREPDLIAYEVRRAKQGTNDYVTVKDGTVLPTVSSVSDLPGEGAFRYQVKAYRYAVDAGVSSADATAEVSAAAAPSESSGTGSGAAAGSGGGTAGSSSGGGAASGSGGTATTRPQVTTGGGGGTVDLSNFAAALNARRSTPTTRVEPPDPGFDETLPFEVPSADEPVVEDEPEELGSDEGLGERLVADPDARRRSLGFVAFGLLLFVLGMTGLFLKGEVKRADELEPLSDDPDVPPVEPGALAAVAAVDAAPEAGVDAVPGVVAAPAGGGSSDAEPALPPRRSRRGSAVPASATTIGDPTPSAAAATAASGARRRRATRTSEPGGLAADATPAVPEGPVEVRGAVGATRRPRRRLPLLGPDPTELDEFTPTEQADGDHQEDLLDVLGAPEPPSTPATTNGHHHRRRHAMPPLDAPSLDVPDPVASHT